MSITRQVSIITLILLFSISLVSAGTLLAGGQVDVKSNYQGVNGLSLVGTFSSTPAVNDKITISNANLPSPYGLKTQMVIDVTDPIFEQNFEVINQKPMTTAAFGSADVFAGWNPFRTNEQVIDDCIATFKKDNLIPFADLYPGTNAQVFFTPSGFFCRAMWVINQKQDGWSGTLSNKGFNYDQKINVESVGEMRLVRSQTQDQLVDTIPGVARVAAVGFNSWTNAPLSENGVMAYHSANSLGSSSWKPFYYQTQFATYTSTRSRMIARFTTDQIDLVAEWQNDFATTKNIIQQYNSEVAKIIGARNNEVKTWSATGDVVNAHSSANIISVPYIRTAYVSNIQLVVAGEKFGLFIPTGRPSIVSADSKVTWSETSFGSVKYTVKNTGEAQGTFVINVFCPQTTIIGEQDELKIQAGASVSGDIRVTGKTTDNKDLSQSCSLKMTETTTKESVSKTVSLVAQAKLNCAQGQEDEPSLSGSNYIVLVRDSACKVIQTKTCATPANMFVLKSGKYECVVNDKAPVTTPGTTPTDFSFGLFATTVILAGLAASLTYGYGRTFLTFIPSKNVKKVLLGLSVVVFIMVAYFIPPLVRSFIAFFSF